jgi:hypothetical protein
MRVGVITAIVTRRYANRINARCAHQNAFATGQGFTVVKIVRGPVAVVTFAKDFVVLSVFKTEPFIKDVQRAFP